MRAATAKAAATVVEVKAAVEVEAVAGSGELGGDSCLWLPWRLLDVGAGGDTEGASP